MTSDPERWARIRQVFPATLQRTPAERAAFLREAYGGDRDLEREVESLLAAHVDAGSFAEQPAMLEGLEEMTVAGNHVPDNRATPGAVSDLLRAWSRGDVNARDEVVALVYRELRRRAAAYLRHERKDHGLQPTALVHETYMRLVGQERVAWQNRAHFFGVAAQMMRRIFVDHARRSQAAKRPGAGVRVSLDDRIGASRPVDCEVLLLDQALDDLARVDPRQAQIVELRYFGGLSEQETAAVLSLSRATITREWQTARAWLYRRMTVGRPRRVS